MRKGPFFALLGVLAVVLFTSIPDTKPTKVAASSTPESQDPIQLASAPAPEKVTVDTSWKFERGEYGNVFITGIARNNTSRTLGYVSVSFNLFDGAGNQVGTVTFPQTEVRS